jgi:C4-dicarboxylate-specific signal transduction histidine kinase
MATREVFVANQILTAAEQNALATAMIAINAQTGTTYTTVLTDDGKLITCSNASAISVTIPPNSSVAYGIGTQLNFAQLSTGQVTLVAGAGVTLNSSGTKLKLKDQYSVATCVKTDTNTWFVVGNLSA